MRTVINSRLRRTGWPPADAANDLESALGSRIVGQSTAVSQIAPYVRMFQAGLAPDGRPVGVFLLLGPSGTGKTRTVEALASVLHGNDKNVLKIDCGEYQMDHEVAKLIGAPPGYLGHRETQPMLTQAKLNAVTSERSGLALVLFDEVEKAAPSMTRLLLGVLDKATLRLGDNNSVNFERAMIFMTSNLGASDMMKALRPDFGFQALANEPPDEIAKSLERIGMNAVKRKFSPEFVNRIDVVATYQPLDRESIEQILDHQLAWFQQHLNQRLLARTFPLEITEAAREFLIDRGVSRQYGARELKRAVHRHLVQPVAAMVVNGETAAGEELWVDLAPDGQRLTLTLDGPARPKRPRAA